MCEDYRRFGFFFFFKQKTAYELRISDWSSDVCSSDLAMVRQSRARNIELLLDAPDRQALRPGPHQHPVDLQAGRIAERLELCGCFFEFQDRKSVVEGKSGSVRVGLGGRRNLKKKNKIR